MRLSDFRILTFDCYGTLIDWESGLWAALQKTAERSGLTREAALEAFAAAEFTPGAGHSCNEIFRAFGGGASAIGGAMGR